MKTKRETKDHIFIKPLNPSFCRKKQRENKVKDPPTSQELP